MSRRDFFSGVVAGAVVRSGSRALPVQAGTNRPRPGETAPAPELPAEQLLGYAFGTANKDVTVFDPATRQPLFTRPLGATVRWLSNEQSYWDGRFIWTYDFPDNEVRAIAIDPVAVRVARTVATHGTGPAHSLMLMPDRTTAWVNLAGDDRLAVLNVAAQEVIDYIDVGKFP